MDTTTAQTLQVNIDLWYAILGAGGFLITAGIFIGIWKSDLGWIKARVKEIQDDCENMWGALTKHGEDIQGIKTKVDVLWELRYSVSNSPRQLNTEGEKVLVNSDIKEIIEEKKQELLEKVRQRNPLNPYDAEKVITEITKRIPEFYPDLINRIKSGAFRSGIDMDVVLFVGSIYLRNLIFSDLGFSLEDLDKK